MALHQFQGNDVDRGLDSVVLVLHTKVQVVDLAYLFGFSGLDRTNSGCGLVATNLTDVIPCRKLHLEIVGTNDYVSSVKTRLAQGNIVGHK